MIGVIAELGKRDRQDRKTRIEQWAKLAGIPHTEVTLGDDPKYMDRIGFWRVPGGILRIQSSRKGEFDPAERTEITTQEIGAIIDAFEHPVITESE